MVSTRMHATCPCARRGEHKSSARRGEHSHAHSVSTSRARAVVSTRMHAVSTSRARARVRKHLWRHVARVING